MSLEEEVELLRRIPFFAGMASAQLKLLTFASERIAFKAGEVLFREGEAADAAYVIIDGEAEVVIGAEGDRPTVLSKLVKSEIVGEMAILREARRSATVRALTPLVTLRMSKELFLRSLSEFPQMALSILRHLAHRLDATNQQLREAKNKA